MLCNRCSQAPSRTAPQRRAKPCRTLTCERCGATVLMLHGVAVGIGDATLAQLARFGLASAREPLLRPKGGDG